MKEDHRCHRRIQLLQLRKEGLIFFQAFFSQLQKLHESITTNL